MQSCWEDDMDWPRNMTFVSSDIRHSGAWLIRLNMGTGASISICVSGMLLANCFWLVTDLHLKKQKRSLFYLWRLKKCRDCQNQKQHSGIFEGDLRVVVVVFTNHELALSIQSAFLFFLLTAFYFSTPWLIASIFTWKQAPLISVWFALRKQQLVKHSCWDSHLILHCREFCTTWLTMACGSWGWCS